MNTTADLAIKITRLDADSYHLELHFHTPGASRLLPLRSRLSLDFDRLQALFPDPESYGSALTKALFGDPDNRDYLAEARRLAQEAGLPLRLLFELDSGYMQLIGLRWETLRDPQDGSWLLGQPGVQLARWLHSPEWPPPKALHAPTGRALAVISCPQDLHGHAPWTAGQSVETVNVRLEASLVSLALGVFETRQLAGQTMGDQPVTAERLREALCDEVDVLYLVCPSALRLRLDNPGLYLFLEDEMSAPDPLHATEMLSVLKGCTIPPLVVLAAPQVLESDGSWRQSDPLGALRRLVPGLLEMGAAGVLAFNGAAGQSMLADFLPPMLEVLRAGGEAGPAMAAGLSAVRRQVDAWTPALFVRERSGILWLSPETGAETAASLPETNAWIISASPERFNWLQAFAAGQILWDRSFGERAHSILEQVRQGDPVLIYSSEPQNSLLGMGRALSPPQPVSDWEGERLAVRLELDVLLPAPLSRQQLSEAAPSLEILRSPFASFTQVTAAEWTAINASIAQLNSGLLVTNFA